MPVDFHHHYSPRQLVQPRLAGGGTTATFGAGGVPRQTLAPLLYNLDEHLRMMDEVGIDAAFLSSPTGFGADFETCKIINDDLAEVQKRYPGRFVGLAHVPALGGAKTLAELKRCGQEMGFPGAAITSEINGAPLDTPELDPFWAEASRLDMYVFVHPSVVPPGADYMGDYDLPRAVGREFALVLATLRVINGGVLDRFPDLRIQFGHLCGGIAPVMGRVRGFQDKEFWGTAGDPRHGRLPKLEIDHYLRQRIFCDTGGISGEINGVKAALLEFPSSQVVFGTDYPQEIRTAEVVRRFIDDIRGLGEAGAAILDGNAARLLPRWSRPF